jgi:glycosyltransferase involved in cell wall biosynthesis
MTSPAAARHEFEASDASKLVPNPYISIGMVTYNHERYLAQAIESVLQQRVRTTFELIIYEDCSTDGTREIALDYQRRFPEIVRVLYSNANVGMAENVRRGIAAYRGRYCAGLDGDDFWTDPDKLQKQFEALENHPDLDLCITRGHRFFEDGTTQPDWDYGDADRIVPQTQLLRRPGIIAPSGSMFYRTRVIHDCPDWIFEAPVIDLFHLIAGTSPNGAYYLARDTVAYRITSIGSWSARNRDDYDRVKVEHFTRLLASLEEAERSFGLPKKALALQKGLPHYVLARDALSRRQFGSALVHAGKIGRPYIALRLAELRDRAMAGLRKASSGEIDAVKEAKK